MKSTKERIIDIRENDMTVSKIKIDDNFVEFYKKETGRSYVTKKGLSSFINHLVDIHKLQLFA